MTEPIPTFPTELGEEHAARFVSDGVEHRVVRALDDVWVVQRAGSTDDDFHLEFHRDGSFWDVVGRNGGPNVGLFGVSLTLAFTKLF